MKPIILASASPRRKEILSLLNISFDIIPANIDENVLTIKDIEKVAEDKAIEVLRTNPDKIVIGADTVVVVNNEILGKPKDLKDAKTMIKKLSNNIHSVYTGICLLSKEKKISGLCESKVFVTSISEKEIDDYIQQEHILDAAGSYKIQGIFSKFITKIDGDYWNIVGLPLNWVYEKLKLFHFS